MASNKSVKNKTYIWSVSVFGLKASFETTFETLPAALKWIGKNISFFDKKVSIERIKAPTSKGEESWEK